MAKLVWDRVGERRYESGLDRGVLYLPDGRGVAWNGLTSVEEESHVESEPVYYDGVKISEQTTLGSFSGSMSAIHYPDEFIELEGLCPLRRGVFAAEQRPQHFGLSYRTRMGNDVEGDEARFKTHIIWNVLAIPDDKAYASVSDDPEIVEFEWEITAVPEHIPGMRPTSHIILDSGEVDPYLLDEVCKLLHGSPENDPMLLPMIDLVQYIKEWYRITITDNGDGTWTAVERVPGYIQINADGSFKIKNVNAQFLDPNTYLVSDSDRSHAARIEIVDNEDGTWSAYTDDDNVIIDNGDGTFEIRSIDAELSGPDMYRISNQYDN